MKQHHDNFRSLKDRTFDDEPVRRRARGGRTEMFAAGNPDVLAEAEGKEPYDKGDERKKGGCTKRKDGGKMHRMAGGPVKTRLDRPSRRRKKFTDGGVADDDTAQPPTPAAAAPSSTPWSLPPRAAALVQGAGRINDAATAIGRGVAAGLTAIDRETGPRRAYRVGGRAKVKAK
jgi:hypothetical protein